MSNFSASPWEIKNFKTLHGFLISDNFGVDVAVVSNNNPKAKGNLQLIASAPEMYAILKELVPLLAVHSYSEEVAVEISQLLARIDGTDEVRA